jgi:hypothetical protein
MRLAGWLLTPLVVWVASFFGGWIGALIGRSQPGHSGLFWLVGGAVVGGTLGLFGWFWWGRRVGRFGSGSSPP